MNKEFEEKYAVVTGGAGGISYEAAKTLAKKGLAGVVLADLNIEQATKSTQKLKEETGYSAKNIKLIHKFFTSAGFSNQKIYIFLATGLNKGEPEFYEDEIIEKYEIDINEARNMVINNEIEDAKTAIGILLAKELI